MLLFFCSMRCFGRCLCSKCWRRCCCKCFCSYTSNELLQAFFLFFCPCNLVDDLFNGYIIFILVLFIRILFKQDLLFAFCFQELLLVVPLLSPHQSLIHFHFLHFFLFLLFPHHHLHILYNHLLNFLLEQSLLLSGNCIVTVETQGHLHS